MIYPWYTWEPDDCVDTDIVWSMLGTHESLMIVLTPPLCDLCLVDTNIVWSMLGWHQHCVIYAWYSWEPDDCVDTIFSRGNRQTCCVFAEYSAENQKSMLSEVNIRHKFAGSLACGTRISLCAGHWRNWAFSILGRQEWGILRRARDLSCMKWRAK